MFNRLFSTILLSTFSILLTPIIAFAQPLETSWQEGNGFARFEWIRAGGSTPIYSSVVHLSVSDNTLNIYNTYNAAPLGHMARCGGLGCDLKVGELVGTVEFYDSSSGYLFIASSASGQANFLQSAGCYIEDQYLPVLSCLSLTGPNETGDWYFNFLPAS